MRTSVVLGFGILLAGVWSAGFVQESSGRRGNDAPANGVWVDALGSSRAQIRRPRPGRGQTAPPPPLTISLGGEVYAPGVPLLVNADLAIDLKGGAARFESMVGVDDERKAGRGSVTFEVWVDGQKAADSGLLRSGAPAKRLSVDLHGARHLILSVDAGDGPRDDSADWAGR